MGRAAGADVLKRALSRRFARVTGCAASLALLVLAGGCTGAKPVPDETARAWLPFLEDGRTTAVDVRLELGSPHGQFEGERILTYRLIVAADGKVASVADSPLSCWWADDPRLPAWPAESMANLVLVFDDRHRLVRHRLIQVR